MHTLAQTRQYKTPHCGLPYSSKFFAASTVAILAISSYCIIDSVIYGWKRFENIFFPFSSKIDRYSSMLMLSCAVFTIAALTLFVSYGMFKYRNRNNSLNQTAGKTINNETRSVSGKMFVAASAVATTALACAALTAFLNNQDALSAISGTFGLSKNGMWQGGLGSLLLSFIVSSLAVFVISSLVSCCSKGKNHGIGDAEKQRLLKRYGDISSQINGDNKTVSDQTDSYSTKFERDIGNFEQNSSRRSSILSELEKVDVTQKDKKKELSK